MKFEIIFAQYKNGAGHYSMATPPHCPAAYKTRKINNKNVITTR